MDRSNPFKKWGRVGKRKKSTSTSTRPPKRRKKHKRKDVRVQMRQGPSELPREERRMRCTACGRTPSYTECAQRIAACISKVHGYDPMRIRYPLILNELKRRYEANDKDVTCGDCNKDPPRTEFRQEMEESGVQLLIQTQKRWFGACVISRDK